MKQIALMFFSALAILPSFTVSAQEFSGQPPSMPQTLGVFNPQLAAGWNLVGNPLDSPLNVVETFGSQEKPLEGITDGIVTIWRWNSFYQQWGFYSPQLSSEQNASYAQAKGYFQFSAISPGEGFWVNTLWGVRLTKQVGELFNFYGNSGTLKSGWNLRALTEGISPRELNRKLGDYMWGVPPTYGTFIAQSFISFFAWEPNAARWIFYSPQLEVQGGDMGYNFAQYKGYYDGTYWTLPQGTGFWSNISKEPVSPQPMQQPAVSGGGNGVSDGKG